MPLVITHSDRYESLIEHVENPNGTPSMKSGYQCSDEQCFGRFLGATWIEGGELFISPPPGMTWTMAEKLLKERCIDENHYPLDSWHRSYEVVEKKRKKHVISINLYFVMVRIEPRYHQVFEEIPNEWRFAGRSVTWFRRDGIGFISFSPIWKILKLKNEEMDERWHKALQNSKEDAKHLMKMYTDTAYWSDTQKEPRFWYRVANFMMRTVYAKRFQMLKGMI